jgi:dynein heavy chain
MFYWTVDPCLEFLRQQGQEISPTQDQNLVQTLMRIYGGLLADLEEARDLDIKNKFNILDQRFIFSLVWSIGGSVVASNRKKFDVYVKRLLGGDIVVTTLPEGLKAKKITNFPERPIYDHQILPKREGADARLTNVEWVPWVDLIKQEELQSQAKKKP